MSESESEDEILDRIEAALRKIADVSGPALSGAARIDEGESIDRAALAEKLDRIIARLQTGLENLRPGPGE
jgi:hypothetical protein